MTAFINKLSNDETETTRSRLNQKFVTVTSVLSLAISAAMGMLSDEEGSLLVFRYLSLALSLGIVALGVFQLYLFTNSASRRTSWEGKRLTKHE